LGMAQLLGRYWLLGFSKIWGRLCSQTLVQTKKACTSSYTTHLECVSLQTKSIRSYECKFGKSFYANIVCAFFVSPTASTCPSQNYLLDVSIRKYQATCINYKDSRCAVFSILPNYCAVDRSTCFLENLLFTCFRTFCSLVYCLKT
jgi:hypothetical protein